VATVVVAQEHSDDYLGRGYVPQHGQAFSYSHVIHDHGHSPPGHAAGHDYHHYPVFQPIAFAVEKHIPYAVNVPVGVPVPKPYQVIY
jgi:hypothetical protein